MQSIVLISEKQKIDEIFKSGSIVGKKQYFTNENRYVIEFDVDECLVITFDMSISNEYEESELSCVSINYPCFYLLEFRRINHFRKLLLQIFDKDKMQWGDFDDNIMSSEQIFQKINYDATWDWR